ncbi:KRAB-A domain-containing 2 isoform B [Micractinium conductrix]|uniref:KRAB-A domain-containing 2 isoform B n=1 Tax=Micractinium conductrix TaxID=554055 RepID=A0A2P6V7P1_9CHLO|nr:KRAB-A domain-containing 2 isoform B [Micractinium conductrix]|eukprot:PSC70101.1 KRAB-A domain-containing 2 isoform B [Micractinium conductrix]
MTVTAMNFARQAREASQKTVMLFRNECDSIAAALGGAAGGSGGGVGPGAKAPTRRGGARRKIAAKSAGKGARAQLAFFNTRNNRDLAKDFSLITNEDGTTVLCRRRAREGFFPVVPAEDLDGLLAKEHEALGHPGYETLWTHLVREWSFQCPTCTYKRNNKPAKNPVTTAIRVREVYELQQIDLCDFNSWGHPVYRYVLTIVDHFSKTVWLRPLKSKESAEIAKHLRQLWADTQRPTKLHSDNGREFDGDVAALAKSLGVRTVHGRPYKPTTQGLVENMNQNMQKWMRVAEKSHPGCSWPELLPVVQEQLNATPRRALAGQSPGEVMYGLPNRLQGFAPGSLDLLDEPSGAEDGASDGEQPSGSEELGCNEEEPDTPDGPAPSPSPAKCQRRGAAAPRRPAAKRQHPGAAALQPAKRQRRAVDQQQPQLADGDVVPPQASIPAQQAGSSRVKRAPVPNTQLRGFILEQQQQRSTPRRPAAAGVAAAAAAAAGGSSGSDSDSEEGAALLLNLGLAAGSPGAEAANEEEQAAFQQRAALAAARGAVTTQQPKTWGKIERPRNTRGAVTKEFAVGDCVVLVLAKGQVPKALFKQLACRVVKVHANGTYTLRSNHGVLDHQYPGKELVAAPQNEGDLHFTDTRVQGIPKLPAREAAVAEHAATRSGHIPAVTCACRSGCNARCPCRKAGKTCGRDCKCPAKKRTCSNCG